MQKVRSVALALLTLLLALVLVRLPAPPRDDLDSAWSMTLLFAHRHGLQFGRDIVFTFGPLGFLVSKVNYDGIPLLRFLWEFFAKFAFAVTAIAIGARFSWPRFLGYYLALIVGALIDPSLFTAFGVPLLALCWLLPEDAKTWQKIVAVIWMAIFSAIRLNYWTLSVAALGVLCAREFLRGRWRQPLALVAGFVAMFLLLWKLAGQQVRNLSIYFSSGWEISNGYLSAMSVNQIPAVIWWFGAALWLMTAWFCVSVWWKKNFAAQKWIALYLCVAWFVTWKHGFTRADEGHINLFFPAAAVLFLAARAGFGEQRRWSVLDLAAAVCLFGFVLSPPGHWRALPQIFSERVRETTAQIFQRQACAARFAAGEREDELRHGKPDLHDVVGRQTIDVFNFDQGEILRERLNYRPRPIFQSYSAYTPALLRRNLEFYEKKKAPRFVFARLQSVDDRYRAQDDSLLLEEFPRRYEIRRRAGDYLLLQRRHEQPAKPLLRQSILQQDVSFGDEIPLLPNESECAVELRANFHPSLYGRLRTFFAQPAQMRIVLTDSRNQEHSGRLIPAMAAAGFLVQPLLETLDDFTHYLDGSALSSVRSIRFEAEPGTANSWSRIRIQLLRLPDLPLRSGSSD